MGSARELASSAREPASSSLRARTKSSSVRSASRSVSPAACSIASSSCARVRSGRLARARARCEGPRGVCAIRARRLRRMPAAGRARCEGSRGARSSSWRGPRSRRGSPAQRRRACESCSLISALFASESLDRSERRLASSQPPNPATATATPPPISSAATNARHRVVGGLEGESRRPRCDDRPASRSVPQGRGRVPARWSQPRW